MLPKVTKESGKYLELEGLRGIAAVTVVFLHYINAFAPFLVGLGITTRHTRYDHIIFSSPLQLPFSGSFAVFVFFVLSGFVLSNSFFRKKVNDILVSSAVRRYFRLMFPALASVLLAYVVMRLGLVRSHHTALLTESPGGLGMFWNFPPRIFEALYQGVYGVFFTGVPAVNTYNVVLWTMQVELFGSFLIFMSLALFGKLSRRWIIYGVLALITLKTYYLGFILGMVLCDVWINKPNYIARIPKIPSLVALIGALIVGSWSLGGTYTTYYDHLNVPYFGVEGFITFAHSLAALVIVYSVLRFRPLSSFFSTRPLQFLGKISFSLYLTHFIVMGSLASTLFNLLYPHLGYSYSVLFSFVPAMIVTVVVAALFTKFVDIPSIAWSKAVGNWLLSDVRHSKPSVKDSLPESSPLPLPAPSVALQTVPVEQDI